MLCRHLPETRRDKHPPHHRRNDHPRPAAAMEADQGGRRAGSFYAEERYPIVLDMAGVGCAIRRWWMGRGRGEGAGCHALAEALAAALAEAVTGALMVMLMFGIAAGRGSQPGWPPRGIMVRPSGR